MNLEDLQLIDEVFAVFQCGYYSEKDKRQALFIVFNRNKNNLLDKVHLFKYANKVQMNMIIEAIAEVIIKEQYELYKLLSYSILNGFYKIQAIMIKYPEVDVLSIVKRVWGIDFEFYQRAVKNSAGFMIKNVWTGWDTSDGRLLVLNDYLTLYRHHYQSLSIWKDIEKMFIEAIDRVKNENMY